MFIIIRLDVLHQNKNRLMRLIELVDDTMNEWMGARMSE